MEVAALCHFFWERLSAVIDLNSKVLIRYFYYKKYREGEFFVFEKFNFTYILYFLVITLGIIAARGGIRMIMVLGAVSPVAISFLVVKSTQRYLKEKR